MTVAQLRERMDRRFHAVDERFDAVDKRLDRLSGKMDAGFSSLHDQLNAILRTLKAKNDNQQEILDEHEERLRDLETWRLATRDSV